MVVLDPCDLAIRIFCTEEQTTHCPVDCIATRSHASNLSAWYHSRYSSYTDPIFRMDAARSDSPPCQVLTTSKREAAPRKAPRHNQGGSTAGPAAYDGPESNSKYVRGHSGSVAGARSSSRPGSQVRGSSQTRQAIDATRDPVPQVLLRIVDCGGAAYNIFSQVSPKFTALLRFPKHHAFLISPIAFAIANTSVATR